ncbi:hypothetical protein EI94DRAFT_1699180 [Lactarius quietus]|nr:hypothetical protein EI94DRAFT_1699180 [Lactarius quietus]
MATLNTKDSWDFQSYQIDTREWDHPIRYLKGRVRWRTVPNARREGDLEHYNTGYYAEAATAQRWNRTLHHFEAAQPAGDNLNCNIPIDGLTANLKKPNWPQYLPNSNIVPLHDQTPVTQICKLHVKQWVQMNQTNWEDLISTILNHPKMMRESTEEKDIVDICMSEDQIHHIWEEAEEIHHLWEEAEEAHHHQQEEEDRPLPQ